MKKLVMVLLFAQLTACTAMNGTLSDNSQMAAALFTQLVDNKCRSELNKQEVYKVASLLMTSEQKHNIENKVCGCVAKEAPKHVNFNEIVAAAFDSEKQSQLALKTVAKTIAPCAKQLIGY